MKLVVYLFCGQCIIFWNALNFANGSPLVGEGVRNAMAGEYPSVVSIQLVSQVNSPIEDHVCTGTLVSKNDILTTEHCFGIVDQSPYKLAINLIDLLSNANYYYPAWWLAFLKWATDRNMPVKYSTNDIAIIRLTAEVPDSVPYRSPTYVKSSNLYGEEVSIAGWGKLPNGTTNRYMRTVDLIILTKDECNGRMSRLRRAVTVLEPTFLCTVAEPYALLTKGDSGGPLFYYNSIVAVNKAISPTLDHVSDAEKVNIHVSLIFYKTFIMHASFVL